MRNLLGGLEDERTDEMGYRIEEAENHDDWKKSDEFESFNEYYEYLKQQIPDEEIDQAKLTERKYFYEAIAINTLADEAVKKFNINIEPDFLMEIGRSAMDTKEAEAIIAAYKNLGYNSVAFSDYLNGKLSPSEVKNVREEIRLPNEVAQNLIDFMAGDTEMKNMSSISYSKTKSPNLRQTKVEIY